MDVNKAKPSNRRFWGIAITVLVLPALIVTAFIAQMYSWGGEGNLSLSMSFDKEAIGLNDSLTVTLTLKNTGDQKLRIAEDYGYFSLSVRDENGTAVRHFTRDIDYAPGMKISGSSGSVMKELKPGETMTRTYSVHNYSGFDTSQSYKYYKYRDGYDLQAGHTYKVVGQYTCINSNGFPTLPHWSGSLNAEERTFTMTK